MSLLVLSLLASTQQGACPSEYDLNLNTTTSLNFTGEAVYKSEFDEVQCHGIFCEAANITSINCFRNPDLVSKTSLGFSCNETKNGFKVVDAVVDCKQRLPSDPSCVLRASCFVGFGLVKMKNRLSPGQAVFLVGSVTVVAAIGGGIWCYSSRNCRGEVVEGIPIENTIFPSETLVLNYDGTLEATSFFRSISTANSNAGGLETPEIGEMPSPSSWPEDDVTNADDGDHS